MRAWTPTSASKRGSVLHHDDDHHHPGWCCQMAWYAACMPAIELSGGICMRRQPASMLTTHDRFMTTVSYVLGGTHGDCHTCWEQA